MELQNTASTGPVFDGPIEGISQCTCGDGWLVSSCPVYKQHLQEIRCKDFDRIRRYWRPRFSNLTLEHADGWQRYYVDLEQCLTSAQVLDRIMQINHKGWASPECIGALVDALDTLLRPQRNLCSCGRNLSIDPERLEELVRQNWHEFRKSAGLPEMDDEEEAPLERPQEDAELRAAVPPGYAVVEMPAIDRTAPVCTTCGEVISDPQENGAITLTADSDDMPEGFPCCILVNPRYHVHHRSERCTPEKFERWSPLFTAWFDGFVDTVAFYVTKAEARAA